MRVERIRDVIELKENTKGLTTGFSSVDRILKQIHYYGVVTIASRPGAGATSYALNMLNALARDNYLTVISLKDEPREIAYKLISMESKIPYAKLRDNEIEDIEAYNNALHALDEMHMNITRGNPRDGDALVDFIFEEHKKCPKDRKQIILIDGLRSKDSSLYYSLEGLAWELDALILVTYTLSRATEDESKIPNVETLAIHESDMYDVSDVILTLYRESYYNPLLKDNQIYVYLNKLNNGMNNKRFQFQFRGEIQKFEELEETK